MNKDARIYVAGHTGLVGSAICRLLDAEGYINVLTPDSDCVDLMDQGCTNVWFKDIRPEYVFMAAGKVGGIHANQMEPATFLEDNLRMVTNICMAADWVECQKLLYLGSSCIYPRDCPQPMKEEHLMTGPLEPTCEAYAMAKLCGIKLCQAYRKQYGCNFISAIPCNLYGPNDNFDLQTSHVIPALIRKFHEAKIRGDKEVVVWGTGRARREFMYVDDLARACLLLMDNYSDYRPINVGTGWEMRISELASIVREAVYPEAEIVYNTDRPDGVLCKCLDTSRIEKLGFRSDTPTDRGIAMTYRWYQDQEATANV